MRNPAILIGLTCLVVGCGMLAPTPARHRPPLPAAEPIPDLRVEDVVDQLSAIGYACWFDPPTDIGPSWNCRLGDQDRNDVIDVTMRSDETGPIEHTSVSRHLGGKAEPVDAGALDAVGSDAFGDVLALIVAAAHRPTDTELLAGVQSNYPMELGGGWYLGFDRNILSRSMRIVYRSDPP